MHNFQLKYTKTGFLATCSCGEKLGRASGCNRAGMAYGKVYAWQRYVKHCQSVEAKPVMHEDCRGLAGVKE